MPINHTALFLQWATGVYCLHKQVIQFFQDNGTRLYVLYLYYKRVILHNFVSECYLSLGLWKKFEIYCKLFRFCISNYQAFIKTVFKSPANSFGYRSVQNGNFNVQFPFLSTAAGRMTNCCMRNHTKIKRIQINPFSIPDDLDVMFHERQYTLCTLGKSLDDKFRCITLYNCDNLT